MSDKSIASFVKTHKPYGTPGFLHWERFAEAKFSNYDECNENEQNGSMTWGRENKIVLTLSNDMQWVIVDADGEKYTFDAETKTNECIRHLRWMMDPEWDVQREISASLPTKAMMQKKHRSRCMSWNVQHLFSAWTSPSRATTPSSTTEVGRACLLKLMKSSSEVSFMHVIHQ